MIESELGISLKEGTTKELNMKNVGVRKITHWPKAAEQQHYLIDTKEALGKSMTEPLLSLRAFIS